MGDSHNSETQKLPPPLPKPGTAEPGEGVPVSVSVNDLGATPADEDRDGRVDEVGVDDTGPNGKPDGKVDRVVPTAILPGPGGRDVVVAVMGWAKPDELPDPALLPDVWKGQDVDISKYTGPINARLRDAQNVIELMRGNAGRWRAVAWRAIPLALTLAFGLGWWTGSGCGVVGPTRSARVLDALYRRGHVPPAAEAAARKALLEDGAADPEGDSK